MEAFFFEVAALISLINQLHQLPAHIERANH